MMIYWYIRQHGISHKHAEQNKSVTKEFTLNDSIYMESSRWEKNLWWNIIRGIINLWEVGTDWEEAEGNFL